MHILNKTSWPLRLDIVDIATGTVLKSAGVAARDRDHEFIIQRCSDDPSKRAVVEGTITILPAVHPTRMSDGVYGVNLSVAAEHPLIDGAALRMTPMKMPEQGEHFSLEVPDPPDLKKIRDQFRKVYEREVHFRAKIGPIRISDDGKELGFPIEVVDDRVLQGCFNQFPQHAGNVLLVGYYL